VKASPPKREPRKGLGKGTYEAVLKRIPGLRDVYNRWKAREDPSDEVWLRVIWPAVFPFLDQDLKYSDQAAPKGLPDVSGAVVHPFQLSPVPRPSREVVEDWHWIMNKNERKVRFEIWPIPDPTCAREEQPHLYTVVNVMAALLVVELLGEDVEKFSNAACEYHGVLAGWPERRRRPKRIKFDIEAFRSDPAGHLEKHCGVRTCQPPDSWWYVHAVVRAMVTFPPHVRRLWLQPLLETKKEVPRGTWGYSYAHDLVEELKRTFHVMIGSGGLSQHPFHNGGTVDIVDEWRRLKRDFADGPYELLVEPALPLNEVIGGALTPVSKPLERTLDEVATWLLLRQAGGPRPGRYHVDPVERVRHHDLLMYLLSRRLGQEEGERWLASEALAQSIPMFSAEPWLAELRRGEGCPPDRMTVGTPLEKLLAVIIERRNTNDEGAACQEMLLGSHQGIIYSKADGQPDPEQLLVREEEDLE